MLARLRQKKWTKDEFEVVTKQAQSALKGMLYPLQTRNISLSKGTWIAPVQSVILAQEYDVYQTLLPLFQHSLEEPEVEPSDVLNPEDGKDLIGFLSARLLQLSRKQTAIPTAQITNAQIYA